MEQSNVDFEALFGIQFTPQEVPEEPEYDRENIAILKQKIILTDDLIKKFKETLTNFNRLKKENIKNLQELRKCRQNLKSHLEKNEPWEKKYYDLQSKFGLIEQDLLFKDNLVAARDSSIRQYASLVKDQEVEISQLKAENKTLKASDNIKCEEKWRKKYFNVLKRLRKFNSSNDKSSCSNCSISKDEGQLLTEENNPREFDSSIGIPPSVSSIDTGFESPNISDIESESDLKTSKKKSKKQNNLSIIGTASALNEAEESVPSSTIEIPSEIVFINDNIEVQVVVNNPEVGDNSIVPEANVCGGGYNNSCRPSLSSHNKTVQTFVCTYADAGVNVKSEVLNKLTQTETIVQSRTSSVSRGTDPIDELVEVCEDIVQRKNIQPRNCETESNRDFSVVSSFEELSSFIPAVNYNEEIHLASSFELSSQNQSFEVCDLELEERLHELTFILPNLLSPLPVSPCVSPRATSPESTLKMEEEEELSDVELNMNLSSDCVSSSEEEEEEVSVESTSTYVDVAAQTDLPSCSCQLKNRLVDFGVQVNLSQESEIKSEFLTSPKPMHNKYARKHTYKPREGPQSTQNDSKGGSFWKELALFLMKRTSESSYSGYFETNVDEKPVLGMNSFLEGETSDQLSKKEEILESMPDDGLTVKPMTVVMNREDDHHSNFNFKRNSSTGSHSKDTIEEVDNEEREILPLKKKDKFPKHQYRKRTRSIRKNSLKRMKMTPNTDMQVSHSGTFIVSPVVNKTSHVVQRVLDDALVKEISAVKSSPEVVNISNNIKFESSSNNSWKSKLKDKTNVCIEKMQTEVTCSLNSCTMPSDCGTDDTERMEKPKPKSFRKERTSETISAPLNERRINHSSSTCVSALSNKPAYEQDFIASKIPVFEKFNTPSSNLNAKSQNTIKSYPNVHAHSVQLNIPLNETPLSSHVSECLGESSRGDGKSDTTFLELAHKENVLTDSSEEHSSVDDVDSDDTINVVNKTYPDGPSIYSQETVHLDLSVPFKDNMKNNSSFCIGTQLKSTRDSKPNDNLSIEVCKTSDNNFMEPCGFSLVDRETSTMNDAENILVHDESSKVKISEAKEKIPGNLSTSSVKIHSTSKLNRNTINSNTILSHVNFSQSVFGSESDSDEETISLTANVLTENHNKLSELPSAKNVKGSEVFSQGNSNELIQIQDALNKQSTEKDIKGSCTSKMSIVSKINIGRANEVKHRRFGILQEISSKVQSTSVPCSQESYSCKQVVSSVSSGYSSEVSAHSFSSSSSVSPNTVFSSSFLVNETNIHKDNLHTKFNTKNLLSEPKVIGNQDKRICDSKENDSGFLELASPSLTKNIDVSNTESPVNLQPQKEKNGGSFSKASFRQLCKRSINEKIPVVAPSEVDAIALKRKIIDQARTLSTTPQKKTKTEAELMCKTPLKGNTREQQQRQVLAPGSGGNEASNPFCRLGMSGRRKAVCGTQAVQTTPASHGESSIDESLKSPNYLETSRKQQRVAHTPRRKSCDDPKFPKALHTALEDLPKMNNIAHSAINRRMSDCGIDNSYCSEIRPLVKKKENVIPKHSGKKQHELKCDSSILTQTTAGNNMQVNLSCESTSLIGIEDGTSNESETSDLPGFSKCSEYLPNQKNHFSSFTFTQDIPKPKSESSTKRSTKAAGRGRRGRKPRATGKKTALQKLKDQCVKLRNNSQVGQEVDEELYANDAVVNELTVMSNVCTEIENTKPAEVVIAGENSALHNSEVKSNDGKKSPMVKDQSEVTCSQSQKLFPDTTSDSFQILSEDLTLSDSDENDEYNEGPMKTKSSNSELVAVENIDVTNTSVSSSSVKPVIQKESSQSSFTDRMEYSVQLSFETTNAETRNLNVDLCIDSFENVSKTQDHNISPCFGQQINFEALQMTDIHSHQIPESKECPPLDSCDKTKEANNIKVFDNTENRGNSPCNFVKELDACNESAVKAFDGNQTKDPVILWEDPNSSKIDSPASPPDLQDRSSNSYSCVTIPCSPVQTNAKETPCSPKVMDRNSYNAVISYETSVSSSDSDEGDKEEGVGNGVSGGENEESDEEVDEDDGKDVFKSSENNGINSDVYLTRSKLRSWNGNKSHCKTKLEHSLLAKYVKSHYSGKKKKPKLSREAQKKKELIEEKLQSELDVYIENEFSQESYTNILKFCESLPKNHVEILVKCIVRCVKYTSRDPYDYSNPNAAPLTEVQKRLLTLVVNLEVSHPTIVDDVLKRIHYIVCDYSHHHYDATLFSLARFFLSFCKLRNDKQYVQVFFYDALYCLKLRGYGVLSAILTGFADVFPKAGHCLNDSVLVKVIVFIIFNYGRTSYLKTSSIRSYFSVYYGYKRDDLPNLDALLKLLLEEIKKGTKPEVEQAVLLLSKFQSKWDWTYNKLIKGGLFRIIDSWKLGNASEDAAILSIKLVAFLARTPPYEKEDSSSLMNDFEKLISSNTCTSRVKEACIIGLTSFIQVDELKGFTILRNCKVDDYLENSESVRESLNSVCQRRTNKYWKQFIKNDPKIVPLKVTKTNQRKKKN